MNSTAAIFARLKAEGEIMNALSVYAGDPAIFDDAAPADFDFTTDRSTGQAATVIVIAAPSSDEPDDTFTEFGRRVQQDIRIYARRSGSNAALDYLARQVRDLFHARPDEMTVDGGVVTLAQASGPTQAPTEDPANTGRRITLRLNLERTT